MVTHLPAEGGGRNAGFCEQARKILTVNEPPLPRVNLAEVLLILPLVTTHLYRSSGSGSCREKLSEASARQQQP